MILDDLIVMKKVCTGNYAAAMGANRSKVKVIAAYPITPQTMIVEHCAEFIASGDLNAEYVHVESEHSAMSVCISAEATGVRTFTATSSQGLALMHELMSIASGTRLPIIMPVANRSIAAPISIWGEFNDIMPERDSGWLSVFCENGQEVFDMIIQGYKIAENKDVLLPIMVNLDAFTLTHTVEEINFYEQDDIDKFLPDYKPEHAYLNPDEPMAVGIFTPPEYVMEMRYQTEIAMQKSKEIIENVTKEFNSQFGTNYHGLIEEYKMDDAEVALITTGTLTSLGRKVVDELRAQNKKAGLIKLRFFRPFPIEALQKTTENLKTLGVFDKSVSYGSGGPIYIETKNALYSYTIPIIDFIAGLGGRDITVNDVREMYNILFETRDRKPQNEIVWLNVRKN